jgi:hypothetical protein
MQNTERMQIMVLSLYNAEDHAPEDTDYALYGHIDVSGWSDTAFYDFLETIRAAEDLYGHKRVGLSAKMGDGSQIVIDPDSVETTVDGLFYTVEVPTFVIYQLLESSRYGDRVRRVSRSSWNKHQADATADVVDGTLVMSKYVTP